MFDCLVQRSSSQSSMLVDGYEEVEFLLKDGVLVIFPLLEQNA